MKQVRHVFLSVQFSLNIIMWKQYLVGKTDICIQIGQYMTCSFIALVPRKKEKKRTTGARSPQQVCKNKPGSIFWFWNDLL